MKKYNFPTLTDILTVKVGTKYVWEDRVRQQSTLVHLLEDIYGIKLNLRAFSFYPNQLYFGMPITNSPIFEDSKPLWQKIAKIFQSHKWKVYSAWEHVNPNLAVPQKIDSFDDLGFGHVQVLLSELVLMDLNHPSFGVGQQLELSLFQPFIGFSRGPVSRMVKGRPGSLILKYQNEDDLLKMLTSISRRKSFRTEPFYTKKSSFRPLNCVYKGKVNLNSFFEEKSI
ncbi:MAG: hypothetical protein WAV41_01455 [Microgenomates group bacterium]